MPIMTEKLQKYVFHIIFHRVVKHRFLINDFSWTASTFIHMLAGPMTRHKHYHSSRYKEKCISDNDQYKLISWLAGMVTCHNGHKPKRPQTEKATDRNGHKPERSQTATATSRNGRKPKMPQIETATNRNGHISWHQNTHRTQHYTNCTATSVMHQKSGHFISLCY